MGVLSFKDQLKNKRVQVLSDNITTVAFINGMGGSTQKLDVISRALHVDAINGGIHLTAKFISGRNNWKADFLSRIKSTYEWKLHSNLFRMSPHRQIRFYIVHTIGTIQFNVLGSSNIRNERAGAKRLRLNEQLCECSVRIYSQSATNYKGTAGCGYNNRTQVARTDLVQRLSFNDSRTASMTLSRRTVIAKGPNKEPLKNKKWTIHVYALRISGRQDLDV